VIAFCSVAAACIALGVCELLRNLVAFSATIDRADALRCFTLVVRAGQSLASMERHSPFRKYAARPIGGVAGAGADLIKSIDFGADLLQCMTAILDN
jgi:hypothetical protein